MFINDNKNIIFKKAPTYKDILDLPNHGLFHKKSELISIRDKLYLYDIEKIASYCDYITKFSFNENWLKEQIINNNNNNINYEKLTTTGIANIAFLSLHINDEYIKNICLKHFYNWKNYEINKHKTNYNKFIKYSPFILLSLTLFIIYKKKKFFYSYKK